MVRRWVLLGLLFFFGLAPLWAATPVTVGDFTFVPGESWRRADPLDEKVLGVPFFTFRDQGRPVEVYFNLARYPLSSAEERLRIIEELPKGLPRGDGKFRKPEYMRLGTYQAGFVGYENPNDGHSRFSVLVWGPKWVYSVQLKVPGLNSPFPQEFIRVFETLSLPGDSSHGERAALSPSGSPTTVSTVSGGHTLVTWGNKVSVILPQGSGIAASDIVISPAPQAVSVNPETPVLASCQVTLKRPTTFTKPVVLAMNFDRSALPADAAPEHFIAKRWNSESSTWEARPTAVDLDKGVAVTMADRFSVWHLVYIGRQCVIANTEHFRLVYVRPEWIERTGSAYGETFIIQTPPVRHIQGPEAAMMVRQFLDRAYTAYQRAGFPMLFSSRRSQAQALAGSVLSLNLRPFTEWVFLNCDPIGTKLTAQMDDEEANRRSGITGAIRLGRDYSSLDELRTICAHELFHGIQNEYSNLITMALHEWWADATAEYAASFVAWGGLIPLDPIRNPVEWLETSLWQTEGFHAYTVDHLISHILSHHPRVSFTRLVEDSFSPILGGAFERIDKHLRTHAGQGLGQSFVNFAGFLLFSAEAPVLEPFVGSPAAARRTIALAANQSETGFQQISLNPGPSGTGLILAPEVPKGMKTRGVRVELQGITSLVGADLYAIPGGKPAAVPARIFEFRPQQTTVTLAVTPGTLLGLVVFNNDWNQLRKPSALPIVGVRLIGTAVDVRLQAVPDPANPLSLTLRAEAMGVPPEIKKLLWRWDIGQGSPSESSTAHTPGNGPQTCEHPARLDAPTERRLSVTLFDADAAKPIHLGQAVLTWKPAALSVCVSPNPLTPGIAGTVTVQPAPAPGETTLFTFGDTTSPVTTSQAAVSHSWPTPGTYKVAVERRAKSGTVLGSAHASVIVAAAPAQTPAKTGVLSMPYLSYEYNSLAQNSGYYSFDSPTGRNPVTWSGLAFSQVMKGKLVESGFTSSQGGSTVTGTLAPDRRSIAEIRFVLDSRNTDSVYDLQGKLDLVTEGIHHDEVVVRDIPLFQSTAIDNTVIYAYHLPSEKILEHTVMLKGTRYAYNVKNKTVETQISYGKERLVSKKSAHQGIWVTFSTDTFLQWVDHGITVDP